MTLKGPEVATTEVESPLLLGRVVLAWAGDFERKSRHEMCGHNVGALISRGYYTIVIMRDPQNNILNMALTLGCDTLIQSAKLQR